jgi:hypothetical protein
LANRKVKVADLVRDKQHTFDNWGQIEETHVIWTDLDLTGSKGFLEGQTIRRAAVLLLNGSWILAHNND